MLMLLPACQHAHVHGDIHHSTARRFAFRMVMNDVAVKCDILFSNLRPQILFWGDVAFETGAQDFQKRHALWVVVLVLLPLQRIRVGQESLHMQTHLVAMHLVLRLHPSKEKRPTWKPFARYSPETGSAVLYVRSTA